MGLSGLSAHSSSRQHACFGQLLGELCMGDVLSVPGTHWEGSQHRLGSESVVVVVATSSAALGALTLGAFGA